MHRFLNVVGPICHKIRLDKGWTQTQVAAKCTVVGFRCTRGIYAKIESQDRKVTDYELFYLALVFGVSLHDLMPKILPEWTKYIITGHCKD